VDELRPPAIDAWIVDLGTVPGPADRSVLPAPGDPEDVWWGLLDEDERRRAEAFRRPADRHDFAAAHAALRTILGRATGTAPAAIELRRLACPLCGGPHGRPALAGTGPAFSLSRARGWAGIAVGTAEPLGVDLELAGSATFADLRSALHADEVAALLALDEHDRELAAQRCWVRKEALLKGRGTGLGIDPDTVTVGLGTGHVEPRGEPVATAGPGGWWLVDVPGPAGVAADRPLVVSVAHRLGPTAEIVVRSTTIDALISPAGGRGD
jgi:4'-phosphopantetheinyl transferase